MGENSEQIHARLSELLSRFDSMALEVTNLGKQLVTTQESVDEVRLKQLEIGRQERRVPAMPPGPDGDQGGGSSDTGPPRLANKGPLLFKTPDRKSVV